MMRYDIKTIGLVGSLLAIPFVFIYCGLASP